MRTGEAVSHWPARGQTPKVAVPAKGKEKLPLGVAQKIDGTGSASMLRHHLPFFTRAHLLRYAGFTSSAT